MYQSPQNRRNFLVALAASLVALESTALADRPDGSTPVLLQPSSDRDLFRVVVELSVEGNVNVPRNPLVSRTSDIKLPIESKASFDYEERFRRPDRAATDSVVTMAERYYHKAQNQGVLDRTDQHCSLRDSVRQTIVRREVSPETIYSNEDYFDRDELELLRLPVSSIALDQLLPTEAVIEGDHYEPSKEALISILNLTSIEANRVEAEVKSITEAEAKIHFRGDIDGSVDGVPTVLRIVGKLSFDRQQNVSTWLAMAIHETREIGRAEPGFDVVANIKMLRKPLEKPIALPTSPPNLDITGPTPTDRLYVDLKSDEVGIAVLMDRPWRMMTDVPGAAMMRMIENDRSIAQCDFRPLPSLKEGTQWTLEAFQNDVKKTLGEQLADLISADERVSETGLRVLRVTASGAVEGVPIQWVLLHFSDDSGRRTLATFTMEGDHVEQFGGSDLQLAGSLRMIERTKKDAKSVVSGSKAVGNQDRIADAAEQNEVQSASDRK